MPRPYKDETEDDFVSRYMSSAHAMEKYPNPEQRAAAAYSIYTSREVAKMLVPTIGLNNEIVMKEEDSPKPYGNVKYADPENGRYPVDTESHIRAAWSYINMPKNSAKVENLTAVKGRIIAAWKNKIDPKGPPSVVKGGAGSGRHPRGKGPKHGDHVRLKGFPGAVSRTIQRVGPGVYNAISRHPNYPNEIGLSRSALNQRFEMPPR